MRNHLILPADSGVDPLHQELENIQIMFKSVVESNARMTFGMGNCVVWLNEIITMDCYISAYTREKLLTIKNSLVDLQYNIKDRT